MAVTKALRERLKSAQRLHASRSLADDLNAIAVECARLPVRDDRSAQAIPEYNSAGLPE